MASLTPQERKGEVVDEAFHDGIVNGGMVLAPALGALYFAMQNPKFRKVNNIISAHCAIDSKPSNRNVSNHCLIFF
jgi:hypothetical protein